MDIKVGGFSLNWLSRILAKMGSFGRSRTEPRARPS